MASWNSIETRFHNYTVIIGAQALHATGYAMGMAKDGMVGNADPADNGCAMVYFGDGAMSQGDVNEAFIFAMSYQAPVVFMIMNNQWAISEPVSLQSKIPLYQRASGFGMPGVQVDGNDVVAMHAVTEWATRHAREGKGPVMVEAYTYRLGAHTTSDDPTKYRLREEEEEWRGKDPLDRVERYLRDKGLIDDAYLAQLDEEGDALGEHLREACKTLTEPTMDLAFDNVYINKPKTLAQQQQAYAEYAASFEQEK
ncbi:3-methyl-2-oxobutanoate dehydrogenase subunit alpha [Platysternon megacephalum]|uniref:2-oxoisovalerate dehydrogenase subunit alpha n=1 Tax=Platysternon megacephalum TaxID=55544 RepID=A0A4D9DDD5_9SAUR|nr:3-methyl-2-oxobutanoate dehydrogenase subunit alpha [Platysternon megacephalum]